MKDLLKSLLNKYVIGVLFLSFFIACIWKVDRIDSGMTGILVNLAGSERGVDDAKVETGWVIYNRFSQQLFEYPAFIRIVDYNEFDIQDKKGTIFKVDPTVEYYIERPNAKKVFLLYRKDIEALEQTALLTEIKNAYKDISGLYDTDSIINNRPQFEAEVEKTLVERLLVKGFTFNNIQSSIKPNATLQKAIDEKNTAIQNAERIENELRGIRAEANKDIERARGKFKADSIINAAITPKLMSYKAIEKWNGVVPTVSGTGNIIPFVDLSDLMKSK